VRFGSFVLLPQRALYRNGEPVAMGGRSLDLLSAIVLARGAVVSSDELMRAAWQGRVVVENALHQHIKGLRKALGVDAGLIQTVFGRGYRLMAAVDPVEEMQADAGRPVRPPRLVTPILGRERELELLGNRLSQGRLVTVVGAAGMGKTRLVTEFAMRWIAQGGDAAWCDLSATDSGERLPAAVARGLGLPEGQVDPAGRQVGLALVDRELLLVLNNCEQVADACAELVASLLERCSGLRVLASSQRALGLTAESRLMLGPLALPQDGNGISESGETSPAVRLLLQRAESLGAEAPVPAEHVVAAALARRVEGNPLGIELVAARVAALGWSATLQALSEHYRLLCDVGHATLPRHRSLDAAIAWGSGLLAEGQRQVWHSLAIFRGGWTLEAAQAVLADLLPDPVTAARCMADLVDHSMIQRDPEAATPRFRMHEAYRCHALGVSEAGGRSPQLARSHAVYLATWLERQAADLDTTTDADWLARAGPELENLNSALQWALRSSDAALAARLVSAGFGLWRMRDLLPSVISATAHPLLAERLEIAAASPVDARLQLAQALAMLGESSDATALAAAANVARQSADLWLDTVARVQARLCLASVYARAGQGQAQSAAVDEAAALLGRRRKGRTYGWLCVARAWEQQLQGNLPAALSAVLEARVAWGAIGAWLDEGRAMIHAADLRLALGDVALAISTGHEAVSWFEGRLHQAERGRAMVNLGAAYAARGSRDQARHLLAAGVHALGGQDFTYWAFDHLAALAAASGEHRWAARWVGYADAGYARHHVGRRLVNEARARDLVMPILAHSLGAEELGQLMESGSAAEEQFMLASVAVLDVRASALAGELPR
jgi:predicted ATPase/DNA-binding winged helix-turn-helix (wHTH) protein